jgi:hypothetical protein
MQVNVWLSGGTIQNAQDMEESEIKHASLLQKNIIRV